MKLTFLGATQTVTGSKYLLETQNQKILVDCGLFQGYKELRLRNWAPLPFDPKSLDAVVITHAHIDHTGYLPLLVKNGFKGRIYATEATFDLCSILLPDSGHLQEEDAETRPQARTWLPNCCTSRLYSSRQNQFLQPCHPRRKYGRPRAVHDPQHSCP